MSHLGKFWGSMLVVASVLTVRIVAVQSFFTNDLKQLVFFSDEHFNEYFNSSVGDLLLNTLLFLAIGIFLLANLYRDRSPSASALKKLALTVTNYVSILFGVLILAFLIQNLLLEANIPLQLDRIFSMNWGSVFVVGSMVSFVTGLFLLNYLLTHNISKRGISIANRTGALFVAGLISLPVFLLLDLKVSPFAFYTLSFAYIVLLDVFTDSKNISISWLVIWLLFLSGGTSLQLYKYYNDAVLENKRTFTQFLGDEVNSVPEHLWTPKSWEQNLEPGLSYALYESDKLIIGDFNIYPIHYSFDTIPPLNAAVEYAENNQEVYIQRVSPGRVVLVGKRSSSFINSISLFSFVFCVFVFIAFILLLLNSRFRLLPNKWNLSFSKHPTLRKRIQLVLFGLLMTTFVAICFFTIYFFRYDSYQDSEDKISASLTRTLSYLDNNPGMLTKLSEGVAIEPIHDRNMEILTGLDLLYFDKYGKVVQDPDNQRIHNWPYRLPFATYANLNVPNYGRIVRTGLKGRPE